ncbi:hypothetical protein OOK31_38540 [Streptomyces sp. NBC_00249]|uniref:hypothetical protein n=1 Tax=Streptomyces sp. NBC_00249 TaxID=2975690 RepID=UPI00225C088A|nr:hypothetical protein [Streptomyces sp. NBC_00249]MCX5199711.1 hypothetical protein [Streptomyces sp. NBC_00249]
MDVRASIRAARKELAEPEAMRAEVAFELDCLLPCATERGMDVTAVIELIGPDMVAAGVLSYALAFRAADLHPGLDVPQEAGETLGFLLPHLVSSEQAEALGWKRPTG